MRRSRLTESSQVARQAAVIEVTAAGRRHVYGVGNNVLPAISQPVVGPTVVIFFGHRWLRVAGNAVVMYVRAERPW